LKAISFLGSANFIGMIIHSP